MHAPAQPVFEVGARRHDGKFNVWRRYSYGPWTIVRVFWKLARAEQWVRERRDQRRRAR